MIPEPRYPVHWGTFDLGLHPWAEPAETLIALAEQRGARILTPTIGAPFEPALVEGPTPWWRDVRREPAHGALDTAAEPAASR